MEINILQDQNELTCSICNESLTLFGSKPLKNGILCRNCAQLISPWLTDNDLSKKDVDSLKVHLVNRDKNLENLQQFNPDVTVEGKYSLFIDTASKQFCISKKKDLLRDNADLFNFDSISEIAFMDEAYKKTETVDVYFEIRLKGCEIKKIRFRVNEFAAVEKGSHQHFEARAKANEYVQAFTTKCGFECNKLQLKRR